MRRWFFYLLLSSCSAFVIQAHAQLHPTVTDSAVLPDKDTLPAREKELIVGNILLSGNRRTRDFIVMREITFRKGTRIIEADLPGRLLQVRNNLMNTLLFVDVSVKEAGRVGNVITIEVLMKERWYFFPMPYFRLVDRNFNQWWVEQHRSLDRVNYGLKFTQNNFSGRNDDLDIWLISGYNRQFTLRYNLPFFNKKLTKGFSIGIITATQKELNYATGDNQQLFFKQETPVRKTWRVELAYSYRPDVAQRHFFRIGYAGEQVADTVLKLNPGYLPGQRTSQRYLDFTYLYKYYHVDLISYPTRGFMLETSLYRKGLAHENGYWQLYGRAVFARPLSRNSFLHIEALGTAKAPFQNYFVNQRLLGYGNLGMQGLEYNVVDGMAGGILKTAVHSQILSFVLHNPFPSKTHDRIPFRIFLKAYGNVGYAYNPTTLGSNTLNNTLLRTWGFGMDIVSIYDFVFKIEYSFNQLGRDGLYLQTRNDF